MRKSIIAGNWKMYKKIDEARDLAKALVSKIGKESRVEIVICPPFTALSSVYEVIKNTSISLGAQNMYFETEGAYTGEISPLFLIDVGCKYVIIGHSERREYFKEDDELVNKKVQAAINQGLIPIVCIGETLEQRERGESKDVVKREFIKGFKDFGPKEVKKIVIAYEPIWAIGTGRTATPEIAEEMHRFIRDLIKEKYGSEIADGFRILYGGSVKPDNIKGLIAEDDIDGALVGGASLSSDSFLRIIEGAIM